MSAIEDVRSASTQQSSGTIEGGNFDETPVRTADALVKIESKTP